MGGPGYPTLRAAWPDLAGAGAAARVAARCPMAGLAAVFVLAGRALRPGALARGVCVPGADLGLLFVGAAGMVVYVDRRAALVGSVPVLSALVVEELGRASCPVGGAVAGRRG